MANHEWPDRDSGSCPPSNVEVPLEPSKRVSPGESVFREDTAPRRGYREPTGRLASLRIIMATMLGREAQDRLYDPEGDEYVKCSRGRERFDVADAMGRGK